MKLSHRFSSLHYKAPFFCLVGSLFPTLLMAHPGHYHPDETDEFDFFRAVFFHPHGTLDYILAGVLFTALVLACYGNKPAIRAGALMTILGTLCLLPIL